MALSFRPQEARNSETFCIFSANPGHLLSYTELGMVVLPAAPSGGPLANIVREAVRTTPTYTVGSVFFSRTQPWGGRAPERG